MKIYDGEGEVAPPQPGGPGESRRPVGVAELAVVGEDTTLVTSGLGSCVAVGVTDRENAAGLLHVMLPSADDRAVDNPAKFADTGVAALLSALRSAGADETSFLAKIAGGSEMIRFQSQQRSIGARNVDAVRAALSTADVPLEGEDVGGDHGRSVEFSTSGDLRVRTARGGPRVV